MFGMNGVGRQIDGVGDCCEVTMSGFERQDRSLAAVL